MERVGLLILSLILVCPSPGLAGYEETPQVKRESRLAMYLVRRYCQPTYIMKSLNKDGGVPQWTWTAVLMSDGRYKVAVEDFTWDVDVATRKVDPGSAVQAAVANQQLPDSCLCVEGTPRPPADRMPAGANRSKSASPAEPGPAGAPAPAAGPAASAGKPSARSRSAPASGAATTPSLPGWLIGTWQGDAKGGVIRLRFSADGTWRRERVEPGGKDPVLTVEGTAAPAGTAFRLKVKTVRSAPGARSGEKPPKVGSSVDAFCYQSGDGGLIMMSSGTTFRAKRAGD